MQLNSQGRSGILKSLGPGLLMAGAAIGGSHLVQSTRAGADYGFGLWWAIFLACLFKYPFFEYGPRYTAATGESLLSGYKRIGNWALVVFIIFTISTMFIVEAALVLVTAGLAGQMTGLTLNPQVWSTIVLVVIMIMLLLGRYPLLDSLIKVIIVVLSITTLFAVISLLFAGQGPRETVPVSDYVNVGGILFIVALMGWMPSIVDISVWHSLWSIERRRQTGHSASLKEARFDFNLGYLGTAFLAFAFLSLGALVMSGSGESFSNSGVAFAGQLVSLYTNALGSWAGPVISIAAFTTMFSTTLTVTDAYPRVVRSVVEIILPPKQTENRHHMLYFGSMVVLALVALSVIAFLQSGIKTMMDIATTLSFLTTPVLAYINFRAVTHPGMPEEGVPGKGMRILSWAGIVFWAAFAIIYLIVQVG